MLRLMQAELQGIKWVDKSSVCLTYFMRMMFSYSTNGAERSLRNLMQLMKVYEKSSGQLVNAAESCFYIAEKFQHRESISSRVTEMARGEIPFNYLGVPLLKFEGRLMVGRRNFFHLGAISHLSSPCMLPSYPICTMASTIVPKSVLRNIERIMSNFLWDVQGNSRTHWVSWSNICRPISEGGLGIHRLEPLISRNSLWAKYAKAKYFRSDDICVPAQASPMWRTLQSYYPILCKHSRWIIGVGMRKFWADNWVGERLLARFLRIILLQLQKV